MSKRVLLFTSITAHPVILALLLILSSETPTRVALLLMSALKHSLHNFTKDCPGTSWNVVPRTADVHVVAPNPDENEPTEHFSHCVSDIDEHAFLVNDPG